MDILRILRVITFWLVLCSAITNVSAQRTGAAFLTINPDVRSGGMGETGVAITPDLSDFVANPAKLVFIPQKSGASISYTPLMSSLSNGIYLAYAGGFYKLNEKSTLGSTLRFFSHGKFELSDNNSYSLGQYQPIECALDLSYARKFGENFGISTSARYIYSGLSSSNPSINGIANSGNAFAMDFAFFLNSDATILGNEAKISYGLYVSNLGTKLSYQNQVQKDYLPANIRLGAASSFKIDDRNSVTFAFDFNKLLVPSASGSIPEDYSAATSIVRSLNDAPGGLPEELKEVTMGIGAEYSLHEAFALRMGYHYEHPENGSRRYITFGAGLFYRQMKIDLAYVAAGAQNNTPAGSLRIGIAFHFGEN
jgi:hypothetical protein